MQHIKTGEDVRVSRRVVAAFVLMTMADFSDQLFGFQDVLFDNSDGRLEFSGNNFAAALWPGDGKPGLWVSSISRMGALYTLIAREEELYAMELSEQRTCDDIETADHHRTSETERDDDDGELELVIPPVFEGCTRVLDAGEQIGARDLYWGAVCDSGNKEGIGREEALVRSVGKNPFLGEPRVVLSQLYLSQGRYEEAEKEAEEGLRLILEWGSPWDKRMSWEGWVAWARVLLMKAKEKSWPHNAWGILNLGLVR